jgi:hypothetical protein
LFLALRLALVAAHARRGVHLPIVLDDVLVNFDLPRAKAAAVVLRNFARAGHQILIFTCHEHIARLFKHLKAEVRTLPDNGQPQATAEAGRRAKRPLELPSEPEHEEEFEPAPALEEVAAPLAVEVDEPPTAPVVVEAPPAPAAAPPKPAPRPARIAKPRVERRLERVDWSAEEFAGELADRVRRDPAPPSRRSGESDSSPDSEERSALDDDADAA